MRILFAVFLAIMPASAMAAMLDEGVDALRKGNYVAAVNIIQPLALQGNPDAQFNLCGMYYQAQGVPKNDVEAFRWCKTSAENGNIEAMFNLALMYQNGEGIGQNYNAAKYWYKEAADRGNQSAVYNLAELDGTAKQAANNLAAKLAPQQMPRQNMPIMSQPAVQVASNAPVNIAQNNMPNPAIGLQNLQPASGVVKIVPDVQPEILVVERSEVVDPVTACLIAAQQGKVYDVCDKEEKQTTEVLAIAPKPKSITEKQMPHSFVMDTENNFGAALEQAKKGDSVAQNNLGMMYKNGKGVAKNYTEAVKWLEKAASKGNVDAMLNLAAIYQKGEGGKANPELAYSWYNLAADRTQNASDKKMALANVQRLSNQLTSEQIGNALIYITKLDEKIPQI